MISTQALSMTLGTNPLSHVCYQCPTQVLDSKREATTSAWSPFCNDLIAAAWFAVEYIPVSHSLNNLNSLLILKEIFHIFT